MKYITAFILLLFFSFAVIISILTSVINNYSKETKEEVMKNITLSACEYFEGQLRLTDDKIFRSSSAKTRKALTVCSPSSRLTPTILR